MAKNLANAETLREILWAIDATGIEIDPERRAEIVLAIQAPRDWLDRFGPDNLNRVFRDAGAALSAAGTLRRAGAALRRAAETECNGIERYDSALRRRVASLTDSDMEGLQRTRERAKADARAALSALLGAAADRLEIEFQADPRGAMLKLWNRGRRDFGSPVWSI